MTNDQPDWTAVFARPQTQLAGSPYTIGAVTDTRNFTLAPDTSIVCVLIPSFFNVVSLQIHGLTSGFTYVKAQPDLTSFHPYYVAAINSAVDSGISITVQAGATTTIYVSSIPDPIASIVLPNQPAPWEVPNQPPLMVDFANPGAGADATVIPAPSNAQSIYLHTMFWNWTVASATTTGRFRDATPTDVCADNAGVAGQPRYMDYKGAKLHGGQAFLFHQLGAAAANTTFAQGMITYSIY